MNLSDPPKDGLHSEDKLICAGLLGLCLTLVFPLDGIRNPDGCSLVALYLFAVSIPLLATSIMIFSTESFFQNSDHHAIFRLIILIAGPLTAFAGIDLLFWHMRWAVGILFTVTSAGGLFFCALFRSQLRHMKSRTPPRA